MFNYSEFIDAIKATIKSMGYVSFVQTVNKSNVSYDGLTVEVEDTYRMCPTFNLNQLYLMYTSGTELDEIVQSIINSLKKEIPEMDISVMMDYEKAKNNLFIRVSNLKKSGSLIQKAPHKLLPGDLVMTFHVKIHSSEELMSTVVTYDLMRSWNIGKEQLYRDSMISTQKILPPSMISMKSFMNSVMDMSEDMMDIPPGMPQMYILTNSDSCFGAGVLFYPNICELIKKHGQEFIVIPSSVHEMLLVNVSPHINLQDLGDLVKEMNSNFVEPDEVLSDYLYYYNAETDEFETLWTHVTKQKEAV